MKNEQLNSMNGSLIPSRMLYEAPECKIIEMQGEGNLLSGSFGASSESFGVTDYGDDDLWYN